MTKKITLFDFIAEFQAIRPDNFTRSGLIALFDFLETEDDTQELNVVELCGIYTEYSDIDEFHKDYSQYTYPDTDAIRDVTTVIEVDDTSFIIQAF